MGAALKNRRPTGAPRDASAGAAKKSRRGRFIAALFVLLVLVALALPTFCVGPPGYYIDKYESAPVPLLLLRIPGGFVPEKQTEPHTCGLHSLSSVYRAYGVDPAAAKLRFRLGVDKPVTNFDSTSIGTIHPDIVRVAGQDGFETEILRASAAGTPTRLRAHLSAGHPAMVLIKVNSLHWVVLTRLVGEEVEVCDSLREELYREPFEVYERERVLSVILLMPR